MLGGKNIFFFFKEILLGILDAAIILILASGVFFIYLYENMGEVSLDERKIAQTSVIYDRTGEVVLYEIHGEENRKIIEPQEIPDIVRVATIVAEDKSFYSHFGFDPLAIFRALKKNTQENRIVQGGSTITQQLARNIYLTREKTWERKIREFILSIKIEKKYSKEEILNAYLNEIPYGSNSYGIQAAAETFFGKNAKNLYLDEAAFLAVLPKAPTSLSPYGNKKDEVIARQKMVIKDAYQMELVSFEEAKSALREDTISKIKPLTSPIRAPHFVFYVIEELEEMYGREKLEEGGLRVITTLDWLLQEKAEEVVRERAFKNEKLFGGENASLSAVNPKTGEILVMVGSRDYFDEEIDGQVNVSIRRRSPGSSFKPIVYAVGFSQGLQPETLLWDVRTNFGPDGSGKDYIPSNYDGRYRGMISMRKALAGSLNIPAVKTLYVAGVEKVIEMAEKMGMTTFDRKGQYGLSLAIGGAEVKLIEELGAFSIFANDGKKTQISSIFEVREDGKTVWEKDYSQKRIFDNQIARKINSILSDEKARSDVFGTNNPLNISGKNVAAKTGTTQDFRDAWTLGYTPSLAVGIWVGNNDNHPMYPGSYGAKVAGPIFNDFMTFALQGRQVEKFTPYKKVISKVSETKEKQEIEESKTEPIYFINKNNPLEKGKAKEQKKL